MCRCRARAHSARVACARAPRTRSWDGLIVQGVTYCGYDIADSPHAHYLDHTFYNSDIRFFSDYSVAYAGFAICMLDEPPPSAEPTPAPTNSGCSNIF